MAKLYIPQVGDKIKLISNWNCKIFNEYRNEKIFKGLNIENAEPNTNIDITFPKSTVLRMDRLFVRAPASSFDSITFTVESSPIKSLIKARFWVKLMDANSIEFEEITNNIDTYKKIKDCFRFVALSNDFQNSERLNPEQESVVCKLMFEHFKEKNDNEVIITQKVLVDDLVRHISFDEMRSWRYNDEHVTRYNEKLQQARSIASDTTLVMHILPVLNGFVYYYEANDTAILLDKHFKLFGQYKDDYRSKTRLGSKFSYDHYEYAEKDLHCLTFDESTCISYKGEKQQIDVLKGFSKFIKKIKV